MDRVEPVIRGTRVASFFWVQSAIRADRHRALPFNLDMAIRNPCRAQAPAAAIAQLTAVYRNLLREWADT